MYSEVPYTSDSVLNPCQSEVSETLTVRSPVIHNLRRQTPHASLNQPGAWPPSCPDPLSLHLSISLSSFLFFSLSLYLSSPLPRFLLLLLLIMIWDRPSAFTFSSQEVLCVLLTVDHPWQAIKFNLQIFSLSHGVNTPGSFLSTFCSPRT